MLPKESSHKASNEINSNSYQERYHSFIPFHVLVGFLTLPVVHILKISLQQFFNLSLSDSLDSLQFEIYPYTSSTAAGFLHRPLHLSL